LHFPAIRRLSTKTARLHQLLSFDAQVNPRDVRGRKKDCDRPVEDNAQAPVQRGIAKR
jgi:hypothetical protein